VLEDQKPAGESS